MVLTNLKLEKIWFCEAFRTSYIEDLKVYTNSGLHKITYNIARFVLEWHF